VRPAKAASTWRNWTTGSATGWAARVGPASTNTAHISNKAAETADPGAPTVIVTGHPATGYVRIRQRRRKRK
jgi:hypothetical protein